MVKAKTTSVGSNTRTVMPPPAAAASTDNTVTDPIQAKKAALAAAAAAAKLRGPSREDVTSAITALYGYVANKRDSNPSNALPLLDDEGDDLITLQLTLNTIPRRARSTPYTIPLLHPIYGPLPHGDSRGELCLITKDSIANNIREYLRHNKVNGLTKVFGITELRKDYRQYIDRRQLLAQYQLFLADERIIPLLPNVLGNKFFEKKKQPIPVNLTSSSRAQKDRIDPQSHLLQKRLARARDYTYLYLPAGPSVAIRIARMSLSRFDSVDNILSALPYIIAKIPGRWSNVQSIYVKTNDSMSMPVYAALLTDIPVYRVNVGEKRQRDDNATDDDGADEDDDDDVDNGNDDDAKDDEMIGTADNDDIIDDEDEDDEEDNATPLRSSLTAKQQTLRTKLSGKTSGSIDETIKKSGAKQKDQRVPSSSSSAALKSKKTNAIQSNTISAAAKSSKPIIKTSKSSATTTAAKPTLRTSTPTTRQKSQANEKPTSKKLEQVVTTDNRKKRKVGK